MAVHFVFYEWIEFREKPSGKQWKLLLDAVVKSFKYKKSTIDYDIYIKVLSDGSVSYIMVCTYDILNNTNNETAFYDTRRVLKEEFDIKLYSPSVG